MKANLIELAEPEFCAFTRRLMPGTDNILGVRLPKLRKIARELAKENWREYFVAGPEEYYEEIMLKGMMLGYVQNCSIEERLLYISQYIPKIDNWSLCDSFCSSLKFAKENKAIVWGFLQPYFESLKTYEIRFAVVMTINYFIEEAYVKKLFLKYNAITQDAYYVKMAVAWAISICYVKCKKQTIQYLHENTLDTFTYNKALQKICESLQVPKDEKLEIQKMKRK